jgi:hypothetical protein
VYLEASWRYVLIVFYIIDSLAFLFPYPPPAVERENIEESYANAPPFAAPFGRALSRPESTVRAAGCSQMAAQNVGEEEVGRKGAKRGKITSAREARNS